MLRNTTEHSFSAGLLILAAAFVLIIAGTDSKAQTQSAAQVVETSQKGDPVFRGYKGVTIGTTVSEVHQKIGEPKDSSGGQDFYNFSEKEVVQVFYDGSQRVTAISINYLGENSGAPDCKAVFGLEVKAEADGTIRKLVRYAKAGYLVSYNRLGGDDPVITVTIQKIRQ